MASAEKVVVPPEPVEPEVTYVLTLTPEEAQVLRDLLGFAVIGSGRRRRLLDQVWESLADAGVPRGDSPSSARGFSGVVTFTE